MTTQTETLLKAWNDALETMRARNSQIQAATELYLAGKLNRTELEGWSAKAVAAVRAAGDAERAYRSSYRAA